ncbi:Abi family protein [Cupriavidus sp. TMH.W2]|uniref:Abi family protein n=1 Tax=Cupriavidus sp. TMH.W2 TaxID=3434465 RepID=UPI003D781F27
MLYKLIEVGRRVAQTYQASRNWARFHKTHSHLVEYNKPYKTPSDLARKLHQQGLHIADRRFAELTIFRENYFRFKAYAIPFLDKTTDQFFHGTSFNDLYNLYCADQRMRDFLLPILATLEVRIRAVIDNVVTSTTRDPFWHLDQSLFRSYAPVGQALKKAQDRFSKGKQEFVQHYREKYYTKKSYNNRHCPPFWIISEILTLEQLTSCCKSLNKEHPAFFVSQGKNRLNDAATPFGLTSYDSLITNLSCIMQLRNLCAHHNRLWNRNLQMPAGVQKGRMAPTHINRLYSVLVMLRVMCKAQGIDDGIASFMSGMFASTPTFSRDMGSMGFPSAWQSDSIWQP